VTALVTFLEKVLEFGIKEERGKGHWVQLNPSALLEYSIFTSSVPFTTPAIPSSWPKLPKREARTHLLTISPFPFHMQRKNNSPLSHRSSTPTIIRPTLQRTLNQISRPIRHTRPKEQLSILCWWCGARNQSRDGVDDVGGCWAEGEGAAPAITLGEVG
jgi:hypothetical protein